jgi:hypothetical protein
MRLQHRTLALVAILAVSGGAVAQDAGSADYVVALFVSPASTSGDGAANIDVPGGGSIQMTVLSGAPTNLFAAVYVSPATFLGDFVFDPAGLLFLGLLDGSGTLSQTVAVPAYLGGALLTSVAFVSDGVSIYASAPVTARIL